MSFMCYTEQHYVFIFQTSLLSVDIEIIPVRTRRCFDVHTTSFYHYGCCMDVETTSCTYWDSSTFQLSQWSQDVLKASFISYGHLKDVSETVWSSLQNGNFLDVCYPEQDYIFISYTSLWSVDDIRDCLCSLK